MSERKVPKLRFPEFSGEWKTTTLGDVASNVMYGMGNPAKEYDGINKYLRITDIDEETRTFSEKSLTSPDGALEHKYLVNYEDVLFTRTGASVGKTYFQSTQEQNVYFAGFLIKFELFDVNKKFIYFQTLTNKYNKWVSIMSMRSGQPGINAEEYKTYSFYIPLEITEQTKIANFLTNVDDKIKQLTKKKELLEQYKKSVMRDIFSQKIRFKDDNGNDYPDWELTTLGSVANIQRGSSPRPITDPKWFCNESKVGWVRISDVTRANKYLNVTEQYLSDDGVKKSRYIEVDNIIMGICATIGKPICTNIPVCIHDGFVVFSNLKVNINFFYYFLEKIELRWYKYGQPGSQINLNTEIVQNEHINLPCIEEQVKMANFLTRIDDKITHVNTQLEQTKLFKKSLLKRVFI